MLSDSSKNCLDQLLNETIGNIGGTKEDSENGYSRLALSPDESAAIGALAEFGQREGLFPTTDAFGNLLLFTEKDSRSAFENKTINNLLLVGSHIDTVPNGGNYDGAVGAVAAIVALVDIKKSRMHFSRPTAAIAFRAEESSRFGQAYLGSKALLYGLTRDDLSLVDKNDPDLTLEACLMKEGLDPENVLRPSLKLSDVYRFYESHIEQGPYLEENESDIGIVTSIRGNQRYNVTVKGVSGHSGTYPMNMRADALVAVSQLGLVNKVHELGIKYQASGTATTGYLSTPKGATNVVPGLVIASPEVRADTPEVLDLMDKEFLKIIFPQGSKEKNGALTFIDPQGIVYTVVKAKRTAPHLINQQISGNMYNVATTLGLKTEYMPSGAGHDTANFGEKGGLFFIPGRISHNPKEYVEPDSVFHAYSLIKALLAGGNVPRTGSS
ncbi:MAG: hydantoinase/carbamoylase family amidase [archaeon]